MGFLFSFCRLKRLGVAITIFYDLNCVFKKGYVMEISFGRPIIAIQKKLEENNLSVEDI